MSWPTSPKRGGRNCRSACFALIGSHRADRIDSTLLHRDPLLVLRGLKYGVEYELRQVRIAEVRLGRLALGDAVEEVGDLMNKRVLVTDLKTRHPPLAHVRVLAVADVDRPPAAKRPLVAVVEPLEPVKVVQVPED